MTRAGRAIAVVAAVVLSTGMFHLVPAHATPTTYYVSTTGNDNDAGTVGAPFRTLNKGFSALAAGDTLLIRGGTYSERVNVTGRNGTPSAWYTVANYPGENVVLDGLDSEAKDGNGNFVYAVGLNFFSSSYWRIQGIELERWTGAGVYLTSGSGHFELLDLRIHDLNNPEEYAANPYGTEGILGEGAGDVLVSGCEIYNVGVTSPQSRKDHAIDHASYIGYGSHDWTFNYNSFHDTIGAGIQMYSGGAGDGGSNSYVYNNLLYDNNLAGIVLSDLSNTTVENNTFAGNTQSDVELFESVTGSLFENNVFGSPLTASGSIHVYWRDSSSTSNVFDYNAYRVSAKSAYQGSTLGFTGWQGTGQEAHGVVGDPKFLNEANADFRVQGTSPTLGLADAGVAPVYDYVRNLRQSPYQDMGAYDYNLTYDNFEGYSLNSYAVDYGTWSVTTDGSSVYQQARTPDGSGFKVTTGSTSWTDYQVQAAVKVVGGSGAGANVGLMGRTNASLSSYYLALIRPTEVVLYKDVGGAWTTLGYYSASYPVSTWYTLTLAMDGSAITVSVNGTPRISVTDTSLTSGQVGLYTEYYAEFDELSATPYR